MVNPKAPSPKGAPAGAAKGARADLAAGERKNSLGWNERELGMVLDALDALAASEGKPTKRGYTRWAFRRPTIGVRLEHPGGSAVEMKLAGRNISRGGIALLHNAFVHAGARCSVWIPKLSGGTEAVAGTVRRCVHLKGLLHEVGIRFDRDVDLKRFLPAALLPDFCSLERVEGSTLTGRVLFLDDSEADRALLAQHLKDTRIELTLAATIAEARAAAANQDLIITDWLLEEGNGTELIADLRCKGIDTPAIVLTADPVGLIRQGLTSIPGIMLVSKPLSREQLYRAIAEQLVIGRAKGSGDASGEQETRAVLAMLESGVAGLQVALKGSDATAIASQCAHIRGQAQMHGVREVHEAATAAIAALGAGPAPAQVKEIVQQLGAACRRAISQRGG